MKIKQKQMILESKLNSRDTQDKVSSNIKTRENMCDNRIKQCKYNCKTRGDDYEKIEDV